MLCRLKITVYNIAIRPPKVPKASLDYNLYILARAISLNHLFIPLLSRYTKALLPPLTPPPLYRTLVTLAHQSPLLGRPSFSHKAPSKPCDRMSFYKLRTLLCSPIAYAMPLEDLLYRGRLTREPTRYNDLVIRVFRVKTDVSKENSFVGISI